VPDFVQVNPLQSTESMEIYASCTAACTVQPHNFDKCEMGMNDVRRKNITTYIIVTAQYSWIHFIVVAVDLHIHVDNSDRVYSIHNFDGL